MGRILLIHTGLKASGAGYLYTIFPMGMLSVADKLSKAGYEVVVLDVGIMKLTKNNFNLFKFIEKFKPEFVGIDIHWYQYIFDALKVARTCKDMGINVFLGGITASIFAKDIVENFEFIDAVVIGEGEIPSLQLIKNWGKWDSIPNIVFRENGKARASSIWYSSDQKELDSFDPYNFELLEEYETYLKTSVGGGSYFYFCDTDYIPEKFYFLSVGRGCSRMCSYCGGNSQVFSQLGIAKPKFRSPKKVADDILRLQRMGIDVLYASFDPKPFSKHFWKELFEELSGKKLEIGLIFGAWAGELPSHELLKSMAKIFPPEKSAVELTPESAVEKVRRLNGRGKWKNDELISSAKFIRDLGLKCFIFWTVGLPFETENDAKYTIEFARKMNKIGRSFVSLIPAEPGSPLWAFPEKYNVRLFRKNFIDFYLYSFCLSKGIYPEHPIGYETNLMNEQKLIDLELESYRKLYLENPDYLLQRFKLTMKTHTGIKGRVKAALSILTKNHKWLWLYKRT